MKRIFLFVAAMAECLMAADAAAMIAIAFISALIPAACLRRIKPIDIIKAKE